MNTVYGLLLNAVLALQYQSEIKALYTYTLTAGTYNLTLDQKHTNPNHDLG